jgi:hypothetical protein
MSNLHQAGRALLASISVALLAALAVVSGSAPAKAADESENPGASSIGEATDALMVNQDYACWYGSEEWTLEVRPGRPGGAPFCREVPGTTGGASREYCHRDIGRPEICPQCPNLRGNLGCRS